MFIDRVYRQQKQVRNIVLQVRNIILPIQQLDINLQ